MTDELLGRSERLNPVLETAYAVLPFSADVTLDRPGIATFAATLVASSSSTPSSSSYTSMIPTESFWAEEPLHPIPSKHGAQYLADWIFMVSLLNFSFWSELGDTIEQGRYAVTYKNGVDGKGISAEEKDWTGYWSLPAAINRGMFFAGIGVMYCCLLLPRYCIDLDTQHSKMVSRSRRQNPGRKLPKRN